MNKHSVQLIIAGIMTASALAVAGVSLAAYEAGKTLKNPTTSSSTDLVIDNDFLNKLDVTFTLTCKTTTGYSAYLYDQDKEISKKMTFVSTASATGDYHIARDTWSVDYEVEAGKEFHYRYFIASSTDPNTNATAETGNASNYRTETFSINKTTQSDKWLININFSVNYNTGDGYSMYVCGGFSSWNADAGTRMSWTEGNNWVKTLTVNFGETKSYYEMKYRKYKTDASSDSGQVWENSNRRIPDSYLISAGNAVGSTNITRGWDQNF